ncbi:hypothetical protein D9M69_653200 [compost metagenome]
MNDTIRSQFRIPSSLHEKLKEAADENRRSLNTELIVRLESTFPWKAEDISLALSRFRLRDLMTPSEYEDLVDRIAEKLREDRK